MKRFLLVLVIALAVVGGLVRWRGNQKAAWDAAKEAQKSTQVPAGAVGPSLVLELIGVQQRNNAHPYQCSVGSRSSCASDGSLSPAPREARALPPKHSTSTQGLAEAPDF